MMFLKEKFSSRKFWCAVVNAVVNIAVILLTEYESVEMAALAFSCLGFMVFIISEAVVDCTTIESTIIHCHHIIHEEKTDDDEKPVTSEKAE